MSLYNGVSTGWTGDAGQRQASDAAMRRYGLVVGRDAHVASSTRRPRVQGAIAASCSRAFDLVFAIVLLGVAFPALVLVALALQIDSPGPLFFVQRRMGRAGVAFPCIKFRTMCVDADAVLARHLAANPAARAEWDADFKLRDDPRITRLGALVRKFSIDEFPQLINIIRGEMAVVGPRPIVSAEVEKYSGSYIDYCAVRPGLTGLWQVSGRNNTSYRRRVALDRCYVRRKSFLFDLRIVAMTVPAVLGARGSY